MGKSKYFFEWDKMSSVRSKISNYDCSLLIKENLKGKNWFLPSALSFLSHPSSPKLKNNDNQKLLAKNLILFLDYTTLLEHKIVNRSVEFIAHDLLPVPIPRMQRENALALYTDEGFHALISKRVANQVADVYGLPTTSKDFSRISNLEQLAAGFEEKFSSLGWFLIGFVSETVITKEFLQMGRSTIVTPVYNMLRDHLEDEWAHSHYFSSMFSYIWARLDISEKTFCVETLPKIILECFRLETNWLKEIMTDAGFSESLVTEISGERSSRRSHIERARNGWGATLRSLQKASFFSTPLHVEIFTDQGLIDENTKIFL